MTEEPMPNNLRAWRKQRGWKLADVAGLAGVSISAISLIERGLREPPPEMKVRIARGIGASVAEVFPVLPPEREAVSA
jgi:transcriptional regulator with XRE-family HTH domain